MQKYNWNYPTTMWVGENRINDLGSACKNLNIKKPLLVTDSGLAKSDIIKNALSSLKKDEIKELQDKKLPIRINDWDTIRGARVVYVHPFGF